MSALERKTLTANLVKERLGRELLLLDDDTMDELLSGVILDGILRMNRIVHAGDDQALSKAKDLIETTDEFSVGDDDEFASYEITATDKINAFKSIQSGANTLMNLREKRARNNAAEEVKSANWEDLRL